MICKECKNSGQLSKVTGETTSTLLGGQNNYWDEYGQYHMHSPNTYTTYYRCSKGHSWVEKKKPLCPALDYGDY